jgi:receptor expression-enhancing protein 5/6
MSDKEKYQNKEEFSLYDKYLEQMKLIQEKTGIPGAYVVGALLAAILFVWIGFLERLITNLVGTVYPAFWTIKSIESKTDDDKRWLTYWVVFAFFTIIDMFSGFILKYIPFYFFLKICFLIVLFMPNSQLCNIIYKMLVVRVFKTFEQDIDTATVKITEYTKELVSDGAKLIEKEKPRLITGVINTAANTKAKVYTSSTTSTSATTKNKKKV